MNLQHLVAREELLLPILLHLPLNVIWRLPGWNKLLNQRLMKEHLWKLKCQREFTIVIDKVPSYRLYYLICSTNCYGRLFSDYTRDDRFQRVRRVHIIPYTEKAIVWADDQLFLIAATEEEYQLGDDYEVLAKDVIFYDSHSHIYHVQNDPHTYQLQIKTEQTVQEDYQNEAQYEVTVTSKLLSEKKVIKYQSTGVDVLTLDDQGNLEIVQHYNDNNDEITDRLELDDVVDFAFVTNKWSALRVLTRSGQLQRYSLKSHQLVHEGTEDGKFLKLSENYSYRSGGTLLREGRQIKKRVKRELPYPVRMYGGGTVMIAIDGRGYRQEQPIQLSDELIYSRIIDVHLGQDWVIAQTLREKQYLI